jgi:hypothetical protein
VRSNAVLAVERTWAYSSVVACLRSLTAHLRASVPNWPDSIAPVRSNAPLLRSNAHAADCYIFTLTFERTVPALERISAVSTRRPEAAKL